MVRELSDIEMDTYSRQIVLADIGYEGQLKLRNARFERDPAPLEEECPCPACRRSRAYIRHLFVAGEMLGPVLLSIHNLTYYQRLMDRARSAIEQDRFKEFLAAQMRGWSMTG